jgi:hypothetical protein
MTRERLARTLLLAASSLLPLAATGCSGGDTPTQDESDLTSVRGRSRELRFEGVVYVDPGASEAEILRVVHQQTKTAFGPLKEQDVGVNDRELKGVDPSTFVTREVRVLGEGDDAGEGEARLEVRYTYVDDAVVPRSMAGRSTMSAALLRPDWRSETSRVLAECTANDAEARDFASELWYVFEPGRARCREAMRAEQDAIDAARAALPTIAEGETPVLARAEVERLYVPITIALGADVTNDGDSYPEYHRLFSGGVEDGTLVVSLLNGTIDHEPPPGGIQDDSGYGEWMDSLAEVFAAQPGMRLVAVDGGVDLSTYTLASGKAITGLGFDDFVAFHDGRGFPEGLSYDEERELHRMVAERLEDRWITFEAGGEVAIGGGAPAPFTLRLMTYFGEAGTTAPFKRAIRNSDVFLYNGHSMIGAGPLDPRNFSADDFPASYQILFIDSCISYNYYEADYVPMKEGGTKNLDLVTNALESPAWRSGQALGQFIARLTDGTTASWLELLETAEETGSGLRVVDGELDNEFDPEKTSIALTMER